MSMLSCPIDINNESYCFMNCHESTSKKGQCSEFHANKNYRKKRNIKKKPCNFDSTQFYSIQLGTVPLESVQNLHAPMTTDWKEEDVPAYDPWRSTENKNIIRCLIGGTKTTKKKFQVAERQRMLNLRKECELNLKNNFKHKINISQLIKNLRKLNLDDIDTLIKNIDMSKLFISESNKNIFIKKKYTQETIDKMLIHKFKELMLNHLQK